MASFRLNITKQNVTRCSLSNEEGKDFKCFVQKSIGKLQSYTLIGRSNACIKHKLKMAFDRENNQINVIDIYKENMCFGDQHPLLQG